AFEFSKRKFQSQHGDKVPVWALLASGSTGGVFDEGLTYIDLSVDVIKSHIQLRQTPPTGKPWKYMANEIRMVIAKPGL
ncbi:hypothetical protein C8R48DRAFT_587678, partial [Suillus tomentosus]